MSYKWLITGGCGFVGTNLSDSLLSRNCEVVILDNLSRTGSEQNLTWLRARHGTSWRFSNCDVRDRRAVSRLISEVCPDVIAHLAGQVAMTTSLQDPIKDFEINAKGTLNVLESVRQLYPGAVVTFSSTNKVYGSLEYIRTEETQTRYVMPDYPDGLPETLNLDGSSPYGCSKLAADQYMRDYYRMFGIRTVVFRHSSIYGGRQFSTYDQGWIGWFCMKALESGRNSLEPFKISGSGKQVRDVLETTDLVNLYISAVEKIDVTAGKIYNIGGGPKNSLSLLELFSTLERMNGQKLQFTKLDWRPSDQKSFIADISLANKEIGWKPIIGKEQGLQSMLEWSRELMSVQKSF